ncbi:hypothetical protein TNCV_2627101 [Trichonephila clavipes]|uniref:Uncharacterized protein n=1 Tax=Trichonephila clavipes TaxID=2585209 RepID=A0A8X6W767_TRICX|nr:hypothetical protein TNCV_2627101 [Trichonephila clavipes]
MLKHLRFDIFELQETKLPVRLVNTTKERRLVQGHETPLRVKGDIEDASSELDSSQCGCYEHLGILVTAEEVCGKLKLTWGWVENVSGSRKV